MIEDKKEYHPRTSLISGWNFDTQDKADMCDAIYKVARNSFNGDSFDLIIIIVRLLEELKAR